MYKVHFHVSWEPDIGVIQCDYEGDIPADLLKVKRPELGQMVDAILRGRGRAALRQDPER